MQLLKKLVFTLSFATLSLLPITASAATTVPWTLTNLLDGFISPAKVNGVNQGIQVSASSTIGAGTTASGLTTFGGATTTGAALFQAGVTLSAQGTGCATFTSGVLTSTGIACGSGSGSTYPFPNIVAGANSTSSVTGFTGGLFSLASTTIGGGTQTTGLTVFGDATTTNNNRAAAFIPTSATVPTNGLYLSAANTLGFSTNTTVRATLSTSQLNLSVSAIANNAAGYQLSNASAVSVTAPIIIPDRADTTTGFGAGIQGNLDFIVAGLEMGRFGTAGLGLGSSTPIYPLSVEGISSLGNQALAGFFTATTTTQSSFAGGLTSAGNVNISTTSTGALTVNDGFGSNYFNLATASTTANIFDVASSTGTLLFSVAQSGNVGIGSSTPYATLSVGGDEVIGASSAGGTLGNLFLPKLGTAAGAFLAVDPTGKVISTTTPSGGAGTVTQVNTTYPVTGGPFTTTGTIALAFGTTTSNIWANTQTFTNSPVFSSLGAGTVNSLANGTIYNTSTSTPTISNGLTYSGTIGQFVSGVSGTLGLASIANGNLLGYVGAGSGVPAAVSTSTLYGTCSGGQVVGWSNAVNGLTCIATSTSSGVTSVTGTYPVISSGGSTPAISLGFGTTTTNIWSNLQTFTSGFLSLASSTVGNGLQAGGLTINGGATTTGNFIVGSTTPPFGCPASTCFYVSGNDNSTAGVQGFVGNKNSGTSAYAGFNLENDVGNGNLTNFAGMFLNSSNYTDTTFGTGLNNVSQFILQNTIGSLTLAASTSTSANGYINFLTGGNASSNERARITSTGLFGVGTTSPYAYFSVATSSSTGTPLIVASTATSSTSFAQGTTTVTLTSTQTWTVPANLNLALVIVIGAGGLTGNNGFGGGGGGSTNFGGANSYAITACGGGGGGGNAAGGGGGGGGGGIASTTYTGATLGSSVSVTIGAVASNQTGGTGFKNGGNGDASGSYGGGGGGGSTANGSNATTVTGGAGGNACGGGGGGANTGSGGNSGVGGVGGTQGNGGAAGAGGGGADGNTSGNGGGGGGGNAAGTGGSGTVLAYGAGGGGAVGNTTGAGGGGGASVGANRSGSSGGAGGNGTVRGGGNGGIGGGGAAGGSGQGFYSATYGVGGSSPTAGAVIIQYTTSTAVNYSVATTTAFVVSYVQSSTANATSTPAVGIGTTTPSATLSVQSFGGTIALMIAGFVNNVKYIFEEIDQFGHRITSGPTPTSANANCTGVVGNDNNFRVTTATSQTTCTINFVNSWTNAPICVANEESAGVTVAEASSTPSTVVLTFASALTTKSIAVICEGYQ